MKSTKIKYILILFIIFIGIIFSSNIYAADDIIVVLDPGHGGYDVGAVTDGIQEKDVNWKIATRVKEILDAEPGITGILSRNENECPDLAERAQIAKNTGADLLVSFHINSSESAKASGSEVYITGNTNSKRFYQASNILGQSVLKNLASIGIPSHIYRPIIKYTEENRYYSDGFLADWYGIIREPMYFGIPGMIIEHCYISNPFDRVNYLNDAKINQMAEADAKAIIANKELFRIERENNSTIRIPKEKLSLYCYADIFKEYIPHIPYYLGNNDVMIDIDAFKKIEPSFMRRSLSKYAFLRHLLLGEEVSAADTAAINEYFKNML